MAGWFVSFFTTFVSFNRSTLFRSISWISLACFRISTTQTYKFYTHLPPRQNKSLIPGFCSSFPCVVETSARATSPRNVVDPSPARPFLRRLFRMYDPSVIWALLFQHAYFSFIELVGRAEPSVQGWDRWDSLFVSCYELLPLSRPSLWIRLPFLIATMHVLSRCPVCSR